MRRLLILIAALLTLGLMQPETTLAQMNNQQRLQQYQRQLNRQRAMQTPRHVRINRIPRAFTQQPGQAASQYRQRRLQYERRQGIQSGYYQRQSHVTVRRPRLQRQPGLQGARGAAQVQRYTRQRQRHQARTPGRPALQTVRPMFWR